MSIAYPLEQTMRWFGPDDPVSLADIRQAGATGVVTALHHIPNGAVWPVAEIAARRAMIEAAGLRWSVVESLPVHEAIKQGGADRDAALARYRESLVNLAACGLRTITYNFMPLLDWTRTDLAYELPDGARALRFEPVALAAYDIHVLGRPGAASDYAPAIVAAAAARFAAMDEAARTRLERTIIAGLPGSEESFGSADFLAAIGGYAAIDADALRRNLILFLEAVCPTAEAQGMRLVIHPDDPPFALFGLPRIVSTAADLAALFEAVPSPANGLCFCVGSLGVRADNDLPAMIRQFGSRIHFLHLRNTKRDAEGNFHEAAHLAGDADMVEVMRAIRAVARSERRAIPMRPDHGHQMLDDLHKSRSNPGYTAIGRLRGLAELRGLELGIAALEPREEALA
ncbi:mannonate dehydratase [Sphingomonas morindae]|uniref:Mannonate dehydratase n=1 Tax=Sphingomonas morindae TaxID=1541170 RepID=A0ABY4X6I9_9SPHN|nr:mannonate dehydratase [Sphingomonas morindae]USI72513.1 mannonate dehydratase [Sphingomonas morindae]